MWYKQRVILDSPIGLWSLDSPTTVTDESGYGNDAIITGTVTEMPLVARGIGSLKLAGSDTITVPNQTVMFEDHKFRPFTLEAWIKPKSINGSAWLFKRNNCGILINGETLEFTVSMDQDTTVSWTGLRPGEIYHVVAIYDTNGIYLFVNSVVVDQAGITQADLLTGFPTETNTYLEFSVNSMELVIDSIAIFNYPLNKSGVVGHYNYGVDYPNIRRISGKFNSDQYVIYDGRASLKTDAEISEDGWSNGLIEGLVDTPGLLENLWDSTNGNYGTGSWTYGFNIDAEDSVTLVGGKIYWDSNVTSGITVEVSIDGTNFTAVENGGDPIHSIDITNGVFLTVKITLSQSSDQIQVDTLGFVGYYNKDISGTNDDVNLVVSGDANVTLCHDEYNPSEPDDNFGIILSGSSTMLQLEPDPVLGEFASIEFAIMPGASDSEKTVFQGGSSSVITDSSGNWVPSGLTLYVDGQQITSATAITPNVLHHVVVSFAPTSSAVCIANSATLDAGLNCRIPYVAAYYEDISGLVTTIYDNWIGKPAVVFTDTQISVAEYDDYNSGSPLNMYSYDWQVIPVS